MWRYDVITSSIDFRIGSQTYFKCPIQEITTEIHTLIIYLHTLVNTRLYRKNMAPFLRYYMTKPAGEISLLRPRSGKLITVFVFRWACALIGWWCERLVLMSSSEQLRSGHRCLWLPTTSSKWFLFIYFISKLCHLFSKESKWFLFWYLFYCEKQVIVTCLHSKPCRFKWLLPGQSQIWIRSLWKSSPSVLFKLMCLCILARNRIILVLDQM